MESVMTYEEWAHTRVPGARDVEVVAIAGLGRGLRARKAFARGDVVVEAALGTCASLASARADEKLMRALESVKASAEAVLAMHVLREVYDFHEASAYWPWLASLPRDVDSTAGWTEEELDELEGSNVVAFTRAVKEEWRAEYDALNVTNLSLAYADVFGGEKAEYYTFERFTWAKYIVWSRAIDVRTGSDDGTTARILVPILDMANHSPLTKLVPELDAERKTVRVYAASDFAENVEIRFNYDAKPSQYFLLQYGFIPENNPSECVEVTLRVAAGDPLREAKEDLLKNHGLDPRTRNFEWKPVGIDVDLLAATRVIAMNDDEINDPTSVALAIAGASVSARNDAHTKAVLLKSISSFLEGYKTTLREDTVYVRSRGTNLPSKRKRFAVLLRMREKIILLSSANALFIELPDEDQELVIGACRHAFYSEYDACMSRANGSAFRKYERD